MLKLFSDCETLGFPDQAGEDCVEQVGGLIRGGVVGSGKGKLGKGGGVWEMGKPGFWDLFSGFEIWVRLSL